MTEHLQQLNETVEQIAVLTVLVDPEDIMGLGSLLELLEKLTIKARGIGIKIDDGHRSGTQGPGGKIDLA